MTPHEPFEIQDWGSSATFLRLDPSALLVDLVNSGTSNYVIGLNEAGTPWAAALRMPAPALKLDDFLRDKRQSMPLLDRLAFPLQGGVPVSDQCTLRFGGNSRLVDPTSTKEFLTSQSGQRFEIRSLVTGSTKVIEGIPYPATPSLEDSEDAVDRVLSHAASYTGPFFLSRGAPASETLEDFPTLGSAVARALAVLHNTFPQGPPPSGDIVHSILSEARVALHDAAKVWGVIPASKEAAALRAMIKKAPQWESVPGTARREALLRSADGRLILAQLVKNRITSYSEGFVHGDAHGRNFIIVWFEYQAPPSAGPMDRLLLNDIFRGHLSPDVLYYKRSGHLGVISGEPLSEAVEITRSPHFEVHPIDFDDASFSAIQPQIVDAITFALSAEAITTAFGRAYTTGDDILEAYLSGRYDLR